MDKTRFGCAFLAAVLVAGFGPAIARLDAQAPPPLPPWTIIGKEGSAKATVTVGNETFTFQGGTCRGSSAAFMLIIVDVSARTRFEVNIPNPARADAREAVKPAIDGTFSSGSVTVIPGANATGRSSWRAGGRTATEADLTVTLKNKRSAGEFSGRSDGSPRTPMKGSFSC